MSWKEWGRVLPPVLWTFLPMYAVERLADGYYLAHNATAFFTVSGWRLPLFIMLAVVCSVAAGAFLRDVWKSALSATISVIGFLAAVYAICDPRVCYSAGLDGLEPGRLGFFLISVMIAGGGLGVAVRRVRLTRSSQFLTAFFGLAAVCYYPTVFTFAGAGILPPFQPWAAVLLVAFATGSVSVGVSIDLGLRWGFVVPVASVGAVLIVSEGIASAYLPSIAFDAVVIAAAGCLSAAGGAAIVKAKRASAMTHRTYFSSAFALCLVFVILVMILAVPDEVTGVVPATPGSTQLLAIGTPVYAGGFMVGPPGHSDGAEVTVSFDGTDPTSIQEDNFLAVGMGIHAAGCCVDGIDYSYRFDLYLFHSGNLSMVASAWEACDDNAACGGHSWKVLMFRYSEPLRSSDLSSDVRLMIEWVPAASGYGVLWAYSANGSPPANLTEFVPPAAENHDFNTGVLPGGTLGPQQSASYFFQFGVMSRYPIGHSGWRATVTCPSVLASSWSCIDHAESLGGDQSFWKVFWRWGEEYPGVSAVGQGNSTAEFAYTGTSMKDLAPLW
jgi:hypothetical protein